MMTRQSLILSELRKGGSVEFVMFEEDVNGREVFVNPERVIWVREYLNQTTVI
jgi:queuine/archaeosine tRNA-ribosyltransferase